MLREERLCTCLSHVLLPPISYLLGSCCPQFYLYIGSITGSKFQHCSRLLANCSQTISRLSYCNKTQSQTGRVGP